MLDEPTTGLHRADVERLIAFLSRLVERGDTLVVIEHHPDVMLAADWMVDLGPEGGCGGGQLVFAGSPEEIAAKGRATRANHRAGEKRRPSSKAKRGAETQAAAAMRLQN